MWLVEMSCAPLNSATNLWVAVRSEPACIPAEPECHYTDSELFSQCQSWDGASSSQLSLWSPWWWSICSSTQMETTHYCWCFLQSTSSLCPPSRAPWTCKFHWPFPLGWRLSPRTVPAGNVPAATPASAGLFLQRPPCPCRCWWSEKDPRIEAAVPSRSIFSKHETDQKTPSCARQGWLWGLAPGGWSSGPDVDLQSECADPPPRGPAQSLQLHALSTGMTWRLKWGSGPHIS